MEVDTVYFMGRSGGHIALENSRRQHALAEDDDMQWGGTTTIQFEDYTSLFMGWSQIPSLGMRVMPLTYSRLLPGGCLLVSS